MIDDAYDFEEFLTNERDAYVAKLALINDISIVTANESFLNCFDQLRHRYNTLMQGLAKQSNVYHE